MKKVRLYIWTLAGISTVVLIVGALSFRYFYNSAKEALWNGKMESGQRESREVGRLLEQQLQSGLTQQKVIDNLQQSILNTDIQSEYICMYNQKGIELCHPNPALIGQKIEIGNSMILKNGDDMPFSYLLQKGKANGGVRNFPAEKHRSSEIVNIYPVSGTDWMVATHANLGVLQNELNDLYRRFLLGTLLMMFFVVGLCYVLIRLIYRKYEQITESQITSLNLEVNSLSQINAHLRELQESSKNKTELKDVVEEKTRKRIIAYEKNEIITVETQDIAWIYLDENTILLHTFLNQQYSINGSLDDLMKQLDNEVFYRANRQYIINVNAIKSILMYGKNQLEITIQPTTPDSVIISKNKVAEFKKWLDR